MPAPVRQTCDLQNPGELFLVIRCLLAVQKQGEHNVLFHIQIGDEIVELKDKSNFPPSYPAHLFIIKA